MKTTQRREGISLEYLVKKAGRETDMRSSN